MTTTETVEKKGYNGRPLQMLSYSEKAANDFKVMKDTAKFYIDNAVLNKINKQGQIDQDIFITKKSLYDAYNNFIPSSIFDYATNPTATSNEKFKKYPSKIRPYNILRPNIDLICGEWNKKGFKYDVINADGDDVFNSFLQAKEDVYKKNITQRYINYINQSQESGFETEEVQSPKQVIIDLNNNYKDEKALRGYKALKVLELEAKLIQKWREMFKDWMIAGEAYSYKFPHSSEIEYGRLSPLWVDCDMSNISPLAEDGESAVACFRLSASEITDMFYKEIDEKVLKQVEGQVGYSTVKSFNHVVGLAKDDDHAANKYDCYYVVWKSKVQMGWLTYKDPFTGEEIIDVVDEDYKPDIEAGEKVEWFWGNQAWHAWRIRDNEYLRVEPVPAQRNEMNNFSKCKLTINGKKFSDTESINVSPLYLGMPYQIMYIIIMYRIELTIARNKGKIVLMDQGLINEEDGEDHFIYYAEALGWALVDRNGEDVDKSWNGYQVLDLSLFKDIKELINIANWIKEQWDELLGITRQRKGQIAASDGVGNTQESIFRSSVISDVIFTGFEEFLESELQGLLDLTKFAWVDGKKAQYRTDDGRYEFFAAEPEDYVNSDYSVFAINSSQYGEKLKAIQAQINAVAQRKDVKMSTVVDMIWTESITELQAKLRQAEALEADMIRRQGESEQEQERKLEQMKKDYMIFENMLKRDNINLEWDRKDNNEIIKASVDKDPGAGIDPYLSEVEKQSTERLKRFEESRLKDKELALKGEANQIQREKIKSDERIAKDKNKTALKNKTAGEK